MAELNACDTCHGLGRVQRLENYLDGNNRAQQRYVWVTCDACQGRGVK